MLGTFVVWRGTEWGGVDAGTADSSFLASLGCRNDKGGGSGWASHDKGEWIGVGVGMTRGWGWVRGQQIPPF